MPIAWFLNQLARRKGATGLAMPFEHPDFLHILDRSGYGQEVDHRR